MAQVVLPLLALGSLYILSNKEEYLENDPEGFSTISDAYDTNLKGDLPLRQKTNGAPCEFNDGGAEERERCRQQSEARFRNELITSSTSPPQCVQNYPINQKLDSSSMKEYENQNAYQNKYFGQSQAGVIKAPTPQKLASPFCDENVDKDFAGLDGNVKTSEGFSHNNMTPFFGGKMTGTNINDSGIYETVLDNLQGSGSQLIEKREVGSFFTPESNVQHTHGAPNMNDFLQSRVNPSLKVSNVKPWKEQQIAPGLNQGFTTDGAGGYNSYLQERDSLKPRNVDQLRTANNPKASYSLHNHEGPLLNPIKNIGVMGKMEKNRPDTHSEHGSQRWFTTNGAYTAATMPTNNDHNVSETKGLNSVGYFGANSYANGETGYAPQNYEKSEKTSLPQKPFINLIGTDKKSANSGDYGHKTHEVLENNRSTTNAASLGNAYGANSVLGSVVNPIVNMLRPTRKTNVVGNLRESGNVGGIANATPIYQQNNLPTTNREMVETNDFNHLNYNHLNENLTYQSSGYQPVVNNRDSTTTSALGNPGGATGTGVKPYNAAYAQRNNSIKTFEARTNMGNMSLYNPYENVNIKSTTDQDLCNQRTVVPQQMPFATASTSTFGEVSRDPQPYREESENRMNPDLLTAFKNNPYTQSLSSVA